MRSSAPISALADRFPAESRPLSRAKSGASKTSASRRTIIARHLVAEDSRAMAVPSTGVSRMLTALPRASWMTTTSVIDASPDSQHRAECHDDERHRGKNPAEHRDGGGKLRLFLGPRQERRRIGLLVRDDPPRGGQGFPKPGSRSQIAHRLLACLHVVGPGSRVFECEQLGQALFPETRLGRIDQLHHEPMTEDVEIGREGVVAYAKPVTRGRQVVPVVVQACEAALVKSQGRRCSLLRVVDPRVREDQRHEGSHVDRQSCPSRSA